MVLVRGVTVTSLLIKSVKVEPLCLGILFDGIVNKIDKKIQITLIFAESSVSCYLLCYSRLLCCTYSTLFQRNSDSQLTESVGPVPFPVQTDSWTNKLIQVGLTSSQQTSWVFSAGTIKNSHHNRILQDIGTGNQNSNDSI